MVLNYFEMVGISLQKTEISRALDCSIPPTSYHHFVMRVPILLLILTIGPFTQGIAQNGLSERPEYPTTVRTYTSCEPGHLWIDADWTWNPTSQSYDFREGRCVKSKRNHVYVAGYWKLEEGKWFWVEGEWVRIKSSGIARSRNP